MRSRNKDGIEVREEVREKKGTEKVAKEFISLSKDKQTTLWGSAGVYVVAFVCGAPGEAQPGTEVTILH